MTKHVVRACSCRSEICLRHQPRLLHGSIPWPHHRRILITSHTCFMLLKPLSATFSSRRTPRYYGHHLGTGTITASFLLMLGRGDCGGRGRGGGGMSWGEDRAGCGGGGGAEGATVCGCCGLKHAISIMVKISLKGSGRVPSDFETDLRRTGFGDFDSWRVINMTMTTLFSSRMEGSGSVPV